MSISTQPYKGSRDFYPEDKRLQKWMFSVMRNVCESFGYEEYDAPILEPTELFLTKGSDEIVNEQTYTFQDRGGRSVTLRTEMTPSVSRMVAARRQELQYPARWYSIPGLWRYERPQRGRGREFYQLNADVFGIEGIEADHEIILLADSLMKAYGATDSMYTIKLNSRKFVNELLGSYLGLDNVQSTTLIRLIDRMHKMEPPEFQAIVLEVLTPTQRETGIYEKLMNVMTCTAVETLPEELRSHESIKNLAKLMNLLSVSGLSIIQFDLSLMRGFDYYTDIVFEVFDTNPENNRSMFGGGRYDGLVSLFGVEPVATVGFGMGDITLQNFLQSHDLLPQLTPEIDLYVALIGEVYEQSQSLISSLRSEGVNVYVDSSGRKPEKLIKNALKKDIKYMLFVGESELSEKLYTLKNLASQTEEKQSVERIISVILKMSSNN